MKGAIRGLYRHALILGRNAVLRLRQIRSGGRFADPGKVYWIDPKRVALHTAQRSASNNPAHWVFDNIRDRGKVLGGPWDVDAFPFHELKAVEAIAARIESGTPWRATGFYREILAEIRDGRSPWGCRSASDLDRRCDVVDRLIDSVRRNGYQASRDNSSLLGESDRDPTHTNADEVIVNIGRRGEYLFQDGRHRLAIAQLLGTESIPVKVLVRHEEWQTFRDFLWARARDRTAADQIGRFYQQPTHPDLQDLPGQYSCADEFASIRDSLTATRGTVLDIGANLGFFCHSLEALGFDCVACERDPDMANAATRLRDAEGRHFRVVSGDILAPETVRSIGAVPFDIVLALKALHPLVSSDTTRDRFLRFLSELRVKELYFERPPAGVAIRQAGHRHYSHQELTGLVSAQTGLHRCRLIHRSGVGRELFKLD